LSLETLVLPIKETFFWLVKVHSAVVINWLVIRYATLLHEYHNTCIFYYKSEIIPISDHPRYNQRFWL